MAYKERYLNKDGADIQYVFCGSAWVMGRSLCTYPNFAKVEDGWPKTSTT